MCRRTPSLCNSTSIFSDSEVNWCPELGTVLANDEVKDGLSERGGHPVEKKNAAVDDENYRLRRGLLSGLEGLRVD